MAGVRPSCDVCGGRRGARIESHDLGPYAAPWLRRVCHPCIRRFKRPAWWLAEKQRSPAMEAPRSEGAGDLDAGDTRTRVPARQGA